MMGMIGNPAVARVIFLAFWTGLAGRPGADLKIRFDIDIGKDNHAISPLIYGVNGGTPGAEDGVTFTRSGGNRLTGYNWENNASNAGSDYLHHSDDYLQGGTVPGKTLTDFHDQNLAKGCQSLVTLQAAGYVARDKNGTVSEAETAPSARWVPVVFAKGKPFAAPPDLTDNAVYMDELVDFLTKKYGPSSGARGIRAYSVDNEPALWPGTHARLHPAKTGAAELAARNAELARAVKAVDPGAEIFGGVFYGYMEYASMQDAADWAALKQAGKYDWYIDYFLQRLKQASDSTGRRLLDVLDIHWYPEAQGDRRIIDAGANSANDRKARLQAPRSLWDSTYTEKSWIIQARPGPINLLPRIFSSIRKHNPGTRLAITEFHYGEPGHVTGGLAIADFLGVAGRLDLYATCLWPLESGAYAASAYRLFRNYDGRKSAYGSVNALATASDRENASVSAAFDPGGREIHIVAINKSLTETIQGNFQVTSPAAVTQGKAWGFDQGGAALSEKAAVAAVTGNAFAYTLPPLSAYHLVLATAAPLPASVRVPAGRARPAGGSGKARYSLDGRAMAAPGRRLPKTHLPVLVF